MTVIATLITRRATVHASDSLTTIVREGQSVPTNWELTKIVGVPALRGVMSYWGLAEVRDRNDTVLWSAIDWMRQQAAGANSAASAEVFAAQLATALNAEIARFRFCKPRDTGIGLHFTAYEWIEDRWIPELFLVSNWTDPTYSAIRSTGVSHSRETLGTLSDRKPDPDDGIPAMRLQVANHLSGGGWLRYNNGDPLLYNRAANSISDMLNTMAQRGILTDTDNVKSLISLARRPIEVVSAIQQDFCEVGARLVGGKVHDLAVTPNGEYSSTSGDCP